MSTPSEAHLSFEEAFARVEGEAGDTDQRKSAHLRAGCPQCERRVALAETVIASLRDAAPQASPRQHGLAMKAVRRALSGRKSGLGERLLELLFDSRRARRAEPAVALRGDSPFDRHLLFGDGTCEVDVAFAAHGALVGHVVSGEEEPAAHGTCVLFGPETTRESPLLANGDFHFEGVAPGTYSLLITAGEETLLVPTLDLADGPGPR